MRRAQMLTGKSPGRVGMHWKSLASVNQFHEKLRIYPKLFDMVWTQPALRIRLDCVGE
jgi:hypothetical protein